MSLALADRAVCAKGRHPATSEFGAPFATRDGRSRWRCDGCEHDRLTRGGLPRPLDNSLLDWVVAMRLVRGEDPGRRVTHTERAVAAHIRKRERLPLDRTGDMTAELVGRAQVWCSRRHMNVRELAAGMAVAA